jgi:hypothetical protein
LRLSLSKGAAAGGANTVTRELEDGTTLVWTLGAQAPDGALLSAEVERGPDPVLATTTPDEPSAFIRVLLLPAEWAGKRTISYVDAADAEKPKTQRPTVYFEQPVVR